MERYIDKMKELVKSIEAETKELTSESKVVEESTNDKFIKSLIEEGHIDEGTKEEYTKFFNAKLEKFSVKSPSELDDDKKKEFFNEIEKEWTKDED